MTKEERLKAIKEVSNLTVLKNKIKLQTIKDLRPRLDDLYETIEAASRGGINVKKYQTSNNETNTLFFDNEVCCIKNTKMNRDAKYIYIDKNGDVFDSNYSSRRGEDGNRVFSSTFQIGPCANLSTSEEYRLSVYEQLDYMIQQITCFEQKIYDDIDLQIANKRLEIEKGMQK